MKVVILTEEKLLQVGSEFFLTTLLPNMVMFLDYLINFLTQTTRSHFSKEPLLLLVTNGI